MGRRSRRKFSQEFKNQVVQLYLNGKKRKDIIAEYDLNASTFDRWVSQYNNSGSFKETDNKTPEQIENEKLKKQLRQLQMENDILKQAALVMGRNV